MVAPVNGPITQGFGPTDEPLDGPYLGYRNFNKGYDYGVPVGTPVQSITGGVVTFVGDNGDGWGNSVAVKTPDGFTVHYGHLSSIGVQVGQQIQQGQVVAASGDTGKSTGPHLSLDIWDSSGKFVDPAPFVGASASANVSTGGSVGMSAPLNKWAVAAAAAAQKYGLNPNIFVAQINEESGFDPNAVSSAGAIGIAQFMPSTAAALGIDPNDPYQALDAAAKLMAGYVQQYGGNYGAALTAYLGGPGNVPSDGSVPSFATQYVNDILGSAGGGTSNMPSSDWYNRYSQIAPEFNALDAKYQLLSDGGAVWDPARNAWVIGATVTTDPLSGAQTIQPGTGTVAMTGDEYNRYQQLLPQYNELIDEYQKEQAGTSLSDQIAGLNFEHDSDPRSVDARNSADEFARQMDIRNEASGLAQNAYNQQPVQQKAASDSFQNFLSSSLPGSFGVPSSDLPTQDELFQQAVATVSKGLPKVTPEPYYDNRTLTPPNSGPTLSSYDEGLGIGGYGGGGSPFSGNYTPPAAGNAGPSAGRTSGGVQGPFLGMTPDEINAANAAAPGAKKATAPSASTVVSAPTVPGVSQLTGPNPTNSPFLPGYTPPAIAGSVVAKKAATANPLISRLMGGALEF